MPLPAIFALKETERIAGKGEFWWGVGSALDRKEVRKAAQDAGGTLPVLFSLMRSQAQPKDATPEGIRIWTAWEEDSNVVQPLPAHVLEFSRDHGRDFHYALVCRSSAPLAIGDHGPFDPKQCYQKSGKPPGDRQVTALLQGNIDEGHSPGRYHFGFRAILIKPWFAKLVKPRPLGKTERPLFDAWTDSWMSFVAQARRTI